MKRKVIVGHGIDLRPTKEEIEHTKVREIYRQELKEFREQYGNWIPFGYNVDLLK